MLRKRLIGVVTVKNGWAVQSFGYRRYLPLGRPECLVQNLDRWGADEILVQCIDRSNRRLGPDIELIERLGSLGLKTPLIYAGGIRGVEDGVRCIQCGADRIAIDALLRANPNGIKELSLHLGAQAIVASLPLVYSESNLHWFDYCRQTPTAVGDELIRLFDSGVISETIIIDCEHEGNAKGFNGRLVSEFPIRDVPIIVFGGISENQQVASLLNEPRIVAVAIGNFLSYREHAIQAFKKSMSNLPIRPPQFESTTSILHYV